MKKLLIMTLVLISQTLTAQIKPFEVLNPQVSQGDTLIIRINSQWQGPGVGILMSNLNYLPNKFGYVYIGISIDMEAGKYQIFMTEYGRIRMDIFSDEFNVSERYFNEWFRGRSPVLTKITQERLTKDQKLKNKAYSSVNLSEDYTTGKYREPLDSVGVNDEFGTKRIYGAYDKNKKNIKVERIVSHGGVDLRAAVGTKVYATNSGKVLLAKPMLADGHILMIDHGSGIISMYLHLSKLVIREGNIVKNGQVVAYTGNSGGVPPHLDFRIKVHDTYVDPLRFIEDYNKYVAH